MTKKAEATDPALGSPSRAKKTSSIANELVQEHDRYRELLDYVQAIVWRGNAQTFQFTFISPYAETLLGYPVQRWLDEPNFWSDHIHPDDRESAVAFCAKATNERRSHEFDYRMIAADGRVVRLHDLVHVVLENGQPTELIGIMVDITEKKKAEEELAQSENRLRLTIDAIPCQIWSGPADGSLDFANERWRTYMGLRLDELKGDGWQKMLHPDDRQRVLTAWHEAVANGTLYEQEQRHRGIDGQYRWFLSRGLPLRDSRGRILRWYGTNTDIEGRKRAEHDLRESEQRWRAVFENSTAGIALLDEAGHFMVANSTYEQMVGRTSSELRSLTCRDLTYSAQDCLTTEALIGELLEGRRDRFELEKRYRRKNGGVIWVCSSGSLVRETDGSPRFLVFLVADITQRKRAEHDLRESEQRWRAVFENSTAGIALLDETGHFIIANSMYEEMVGHKSSELRSFTCRDLTYTEQDCAKTEALIGELLQGKRDRFALEKRYRRPDGSVIWVNSSGSLVRETDGSPRFLVFLVADITQRKQAEHDLRESEQRWRAVFANSNVGIALLDETTRFLAANPSYDRMIGYKEDELRLLTLHDIAYSEQDATIAQQAIQELLEGKRDRFEVERRDRRKDGTIIWVRASGSLVPAAEGRPRFLVGVVEDITDRKRLFDQLASERDRLRLLLDLNSTIASKLDIRDFFDVLADSLRKIEGWEYAAVLLPRSASHLQVQLVARSRNELKKGMSLPIEGTAAGNVYRSRHPELFRFADLPPLPANYLELKNWREFARNEGLEVGCNLPLLYDGKVLGVLALHSRNNMEAARADLGFLQELAKLVAIALNNALLYGELSQSRERLERAKETIEDQLRSEFDSERIIGAETGLKGVAQQVQTVGPTDSTVLILGETGTGKELIARAIHDLSPRRNQSFIKVDASAIPAALIESELFGHEKGAFTGAIAQKIGRFEIADKGTLFLDEIGDLPLELQPKLLRVLQDQTFERVGSNRTRHVDVRIIAATNRNLDKMIEEGEFRDDLYYRLKVFPISIPPLRERPEDIPLLVRYFTARYGRRMKKRITGIPPKAMEIFTRYAWPGNVRELQHFIERAVILTCGQVLLAPLAELRQAIQSMPKKSSPRRTMEEIERESILQALRESKWIVGGPHGAAAKLGLKRTTLASKMEKLGISRHSR